MPAGDPPDPRLDAAEACALLLSTARDAAMPLPSLEALIDWAAEAPCDRAWSEGAVCRRAAAELWRDGVEGRSALWGLVTLSLGAARARRVLAAFERRIARRL
ncbi:MAG: hypothetical protein ACFBWO_00030 [Paracoccaceae bacterium]